MEKRKNLFTPKRKKRKGGILPGGVRLSSRKEGGKKSHSSLKVYFGTGGGEGRESLATHPRRKKANDKGEEGGGANEKRKGGLLVSFTNRLKEIKDGVAAHDAGRKERDFFLPEASRRALEILRGKKNLYSEKKGGKGSAFSKDKCQKRGRRTTIVKGIFGKEDGKGGCSQISPRKNYPPGKKKKQDPIC